MGTITFNPDDLAATRTALGLTIGTDVLAPSGSGANLTALNASNIASGTVPAARLGSGTASGTTFLAGDGTYKTVSSGLALLQTVTASNDAAVIIDATAGFDGTYDSLLIVVTGLIPASDGQNLSLQVSTASNDPETGSSYFWSVTGQNQSDITSTASSANAQIGINGSDAQAQIGSATGESANYQIEFSHPDSTSIHKLFNWTGAWSRDDHTGDVTHVIGGGGFLSTTAITKVRLFFGSGNVESGTVRLYGRTDS